MVRVAVIDKELCKPSKCNNECVRFCPMNRTGKKAIEIQQVNGRLRAVINEEVCVGCGICVKKCPYSAISIVNLPDELEKKLIHRYGPNGFKLYGLPAPQEGKVLGILGKNGTGKTTALRILSGELKPNLGLLEEPDWREIIRRFRGTVVQSYFVKLADGKLKVVHKIQYITSARRILKGTVNELLRKADERGMVKEVVESLNMKSMLEKKVAELSGGELQKLITAAALLKDADVYLFDEPCSFLDVKERIAVAKAIRSLLPRNAMVVVVEHDISVLDYISDLISIVYGEPGVFGIVSKSYGVGAGINHFIEGYLPAENMRIRSEPLKFAIREAEGPQAERRNLLVWSNIKKKMGSFKLTADEGSVREREVIGVLGPNATGKTTFVRILVGELEPDEGVVEAKASSLSYKPQYITHDMFEGTVDRVLRSARSDSLSASSWFYTEVVKRLNLHKILLRQVADLSGGELQKLAVAVALAKDAELYVFDEPSAFLDVEERLAVAKAINKVVYERGSAALVVDHDLMFVDAISSRIMVFKGVPGVEGVARSPTVLAKGFNEFLKDLGITFRKDPRTGRPRINKEGSYLDRLQKSMGRYYMIGEVGET